MKLFIPEIGDTIILTKAWKFRLFDEYRNNALLKILKVRESPAYLAHRERRVNMTREDRYADPNWAVPFSQVVTLPKDSILKVSRIYIRNGVSDYSSITFTVDAISAGLGVKRKPRFWAKLADVNTINFKHDEKVET